MFLDSSKILLEIQEKLESIEPKAKEASLDIEDLESEVENLQKQLFELKQENKEKHDDIDRLTMRNDLLIKKKDIISGITDQIEELNSRIKIRKEPRDLSNNDTRDILAKIEEICDLAEIENSKFGEDELDEEIRRLQDANQKAEDEISILEKMNSEKLETDDYSEIIETFCNKSNTLLQSENSGEEVDLTSAAIAQPSADIEIENEELETEENATNNIKELEEIIINFTESQKKATVNSEEVFKNQKTAADRLKAALMKMNVSEANFYKYEQLFLNRIKSMGAIEELTPLQMPANAAQSNEDMIKAIVDEFKEFVAKNNMNSHINSEDSIKRTGEIISSSLPSELPTVKVIKKPSISEHVTKLSLSLQKLNTEVRSNLPTQEQEDIAELYKELNDIKPPEFTRRNTNNIPRMESQNDYDADLSFVDDFKSKATRKLPEEYAPLFEQPVRETPVPRLQNSQKLKEHTHVHVNNDDNPVADLNVQTNALLHAIEEMPLNSFPSLETPSVAPAVQLPPSDAKAEKVLESFNALFDENRYKAKIAEVDAKRFEERAKEIEPEETEVSNDTTMEDLENAEKEHNDLIESVKAIQEECTQRMESISQLGKTLETLESRNAEMQKKYDSMKPNVKDIDHLKKELEQITNEFNDEKEEKTSLLELRRQALSRKAQNNK